MHSESESHQHHHEIDPRLFRRTLIWLTFLMAGTIAAAQINYGTDAPWVSYAANGIALSIACWKATLVVLNFMGVKFASRLTQVYAILGFLWVTLMGVTFCDYFTRKFEPSPGWEELEQNRQVPGAKMQNPWEKAEEGAAEH